jgi:hypothetical protein
MQHGDLALISKGLILTLLWLIGGAALSTKALAQGQKWVTSWAASAHGPYPSGNPSAQPVLSFAFESTVTGETGANDQTFRLIIRPDLWGKRARLRFSNVFGTRPVIFNDVYVGLQSSGGNLAAGTNNRVLFGGKPSLTVAPGQVVYSDAVTLPFVKNANDPLLTGRKLAISFHVAGVTGPLTWHAKALQTSYLTAPRAGSHGHETSDDSFPYTTTSWYFLDALDVQAPADTVVVACFGDSITDGTNSTLNGDDRWPDVLSRRMATASPSSTPESAATRSPGRPVTRPVRPSLVALRRWIGSNAMCSAFPASPTSSGSKASMISRAAPAPKPSAPGCRNSSNEYARMASSKSSARRSPPASAATPLPARLRSMRAAKPSTNSSARVACLTA